MVNFPEFKVSVDRIEKYFVINKFIVESRVSASTRSAAYITFLSGPINRPKAHWTRLAGGINLATIQIRFSQYVGGFAIANTSAWAVGSFSG